MLVMAQISSATRFWAEMTILMVLTLDVYKSISEHILQDVLPMVLMVKEFTFHAYLLLYWVISWCIIYHTTSK